MTAFIVSHKRISALAGWVFRAYACVYFCNQSRSLDISGDDQEASHMLLAENVKGFNCRHDETVEEPMVHGTFATNVRPNDLIEACCRVGSPSCEQCRQDSSTATSAIAAIEDAFILAPSGYDDMRCGMKGIQWVTA